MRKVCDKNRIININNSDCIPKLVKGEELLCSFRNPGHVTGIEEIDYGITLLNDCKGNVI